MFDVGRSAFDRNRSIACSAGSFWEKTFPDRFVGITGFAFGILLPHIFQCRQRAILTGSRRSLRWQCLPAMEAQVFLRAFQVAAFRCRYNGLTSMRRTLSNTFHIAPDKISNR
jgi:hypothetical protein